MRYGTSKETTNTDLLGSTITLIHKIRDYEVHSTKKQYRQRVKVLNKQDETTEYLTFSELLRKKKAEGVLIIKSEDPDLLPSFTIEHSKFDDDNYYYIIKSWTETIK